MSEDLTREIRLWAMGCHLAGLSWLPVALLAWSPGNLFVPVPLINIIITLIIWRWRRDLHDFIDEQGRESLNFQLAQLIYAAIALTLFVLLLVVSFAVSLRLGNVDWVTNTFGLLFIVSGLLLFGLVLFQVIVTISAAIKALQGLPYRYPLTWRLLS